MLSLAPRTPVSGIQCVAVLPLCNTRSLEASGMRYSDSVKQKICRLTGLRWHEVGLPEGLRG